MLPYPYVVALHAVFPPRSIRYAPIQSDFTAWMRAEDTKHRHNLFGLRQHPNTVPGAGNGDGTPLWLCPECHAAASGSFTV